MPSSTSSSERPDDDTAPPLRPVPAQPWRAVTLAALVLLLALLSAWEWRMRSLGLVAGDLGDSPSAWAEQRRRVTDAPDQVLVVGDSRILFGTDLDRYAALTGARPIQLALTGVSGLPVLEHLAQASAFRGLVIVGVSDLHYFGASDDLARPTIDRLRNETPSETVGHHLGRELEQRIAFIDDDYRLSRLLLRLDHGWRAGTSSPYDVVWKIAVTGVDRDTALWDRIANDPNLRRQVIHAWLQETVPAFTDAMLSGRLARTRAAVDAIRARGGEVVFVRPPSAPQFRFGEEGHLPRVRGWDALLAAADAVGVHFEDHAAMQGLELPEYSHLTRACARVHTDAYVRALATLTPRVRLRDDAPRPLAPADCRRKLPAR
jgi:hypothetical protein